MGNTGRITAGELSNGDLSENPVLSKNSYAFMRNIRGSSAYWIKAKLDALHADDMNWFDLMCVLAKCNGENLSDDERLLSSYLAFMNHT